MPFSSGYAEVFTCRSLSHCADIMNYSKTLINDSNLYFCRNWCVTTWVFHLQVRTVCDCEFWCHQQYHLVHTRNLFVFYTNKPLFSHYCTVDGTEYYNNKSATALQCRNIGIQTHVPVTWDFFILSSALQIQIFINKLIDLSQGRTTLYAKKSCLLSDSKHCLPKGSKLFCQKAQLTSR